MVDIVPFPKRETITDEHRLMRQRYDMLVVFDDIKSFKRRQKAIESCKLLAILDRSEP